jgi:5-oxopent-3-ene-1,2,5-tricarboxylate decarboxylase / 2-hydroxyhepta-2,4-diene-1,7-dioate isomerase
MIDSLIDRLRGAPTTLLSDALRGTGRDPARFVITGLPPLVAAPGPVIGPAITTRYEPSDEPVAPEDVRRFVFDPVDAGRPGQVWVIGTGSDLILSMMGDIIALRCQQRGLAAAVIDGGCRDLAALDALGFPVFARGPCPYGPFGMLRPVGANVEVVCRGVEVCPGDLVAADRDGVVVLPPDVAADVARLWPERAAKEARARAQVAEGAPLAGAYPLTPTRPRA